MIAKLHLVLSITILFGGFYGWAQADLWQKGAISNKTVTVAEEGTSYKLATTTMNTLLAGVDSLETTSMYFPDSKGDMIVFKVRETAVFHPDLSKKFPQIKSYSGISEDGALKVRFSNSPLGLKAMLIDKLSGETHFLDKVSGTSNRYLLHRSNANASKTAFSCGTKDKPLAYGPMASRNLVTGRVKRKFRIAVSATGEYTQYYGGTIAEALAGINATLTRVNEVFETDLGVTLELIPNNDAVVFTNSSTDPYTNQLNTQLQSTLSAEIGEANYDVGHLFDTAPSEAENNGNAGFIGAVCVNNQKGSAFVSVFEPEGEVFDLDYVAHELGHQFGANHTWSFSGEGTGVQVEPGSGTTIMGYAGITQENDVAPNGDDYFHHNSIVQIQDYLDGVGCSQNTNLSNRPPTITLVQNNYHIPQGTAFALMANATDPDGDNLTYTWEQIDDGIVTTGTFGPNNVTGANFRSIPPSTAPIRYFPRLSRVIDGLLTQSNPVENDAWETVSEVARAFNFAVTVRDNNLEGGQVVSDTVTVDVESSAGPFRVTSQGTNEVYTAGSIQEITWDVANTNLAPIGTERVTLSLSTDGGVSFPITLADNVPNTGNTQVQLPGTATSAARVMVSAIDNVFFAVNSTDFTITEASAVLDFSSVNYEVCSSESLVVPFVYETYGGFSEQMDLSVNTTAPFTVSFSQTQVTAGDTDISLTLGNTQNVAVGTYEVEVTATGASFSTAVTLSIAVLSDNFSAVVPIFPEDEAQDITINPTFTWQSDPTVNSYDIEVSTDMNFNTIVAAATVVFPFFQSPELLPETVYYWRIKPRNTCGEGSFGPPLRFTTIAVQCKVFESASTPVVIPSVGLPANPR
ncbi:MAG: reprolysin-like metallopeptidase [Bacteroidota bacterium]